MSKSINEIMKKKKTFDEDDVTGKFNPLYIQKYSQYQSRVKGGKKLSMEEERVMHEVSSGGNATKSNNNVELIRKARKNYLRQLAIFKLT